MTKYCAAFLVLVFLGGCERRGQGPSAPASPEPASSKPPLNADDPRSCAPCHGAVVEEWQESMHSRAHHLKDPIYRGLREMRMKKEGHAIADKCASCHTPRAAKADKTYEGEAALAGVSCASCHAISAVDLSRGHGAQALVWAEGTMRGARSIPPDASPVHGTGPALKELADGKTLCLSCHGSLKNAAGVALCATGLEGGSDSPSCVSCHMPEVDGPAGAVSGRQSHRSHAFIGPHRAWYQDDPSVLAEAVSVAARLKGEGVVVELQNRTSHSFPSGFPGRFAVVRVRVLDAQGDQVWSNLEGGMRQAGQGAWLGKVYRDAAGAPVPAAFATTLSLDTRLEAGTSRTVQVRLGERADGGAVEVALLYGLIPKPLGEKIGLRGAPELQPKVIWTTTLKP